MHAAVLPPGGEAGNRAGLICIACLLKNCAKSRVYFLDQRVHRLD